MNVAEGQLGAVVLLFNGVVVVFDDGRRFALRFCFGWKVGWGESLVVDGGEGRVDHGGDD